MAQYKLEQLAAAEKLAAQGHIDLFYGDESGVSSEGYVPYGWQFNDEKVHIPVEKGFRLNCFGLVSRRSECRWATSVQSIDSRFIFDQLERFSLQIVRETFVVFDQARVHTCGLIRSRLAAWQQRGLYVIYLPQYSPHLNLAETLWRKLKKEWLRPQDYLTDDDLAYAVNRCLTNVGTELVIHFSPFNST